MAINNKYCYPSIYAVPFLLLVLLLASTFAAARQSGELVGAWGTKGEMVRANPLQVAGSTLPDCSHACGSCTPCKLKIVTPACARHAVASRPEPCPVSYRCMCRNKSYPVP